MREWVALSRRVHGRVGGSQLGAGFWVANWTAEQPIEAIAPLRQTAAFIGPEITDLGTRRTHGHARSGVSGGKELALPSRSVLGWRSKSMLSLMFALLR